MRVFGLQKEFYYLAKHKPTDLSAKAQERLRWLSGWLTLREHSVSSEEGAQALKLPRSTLYRWQKRLKKEGLQGLEDKSRKPHHLRQPTWSYALVEAVLGERRLNPAWGKRKLVCLLRGKGWTISESMVGRILTYLLRRKEIEPAPVYRHSLKGRRSYKRRPWAQRLPKGYRVQRPGDLVQLDTLTYSPLPGVSFKHFTARDVICRWDVLDVYSRATAHTASMFLDRLKEAPFPIGAIQVDGGSEFKAQFEEECQRRGISLFVLPPRSPKLNGYVERAQGTHRYEFYEAYDLPWTVRELRPLLREWEHTYNFVRPHQALDYRTPAEYLRQYYPEVAPP